MESPQPRAGLGWEMGFLMRGEDLERKARPARAEQVLLVLLVFFAPRGGAQMAFLCFVVGPVFTVRFIISLR